MISRRFQRSVRLLSGIVLVLSAGCVTEPAQEAEPSPPVHETTVYFYPAQGQSAEQQDRDKYECHGWAVKQSGFDPSLPSNPPHLHTSVVSRPPPGSGVAAGAAVGAILGAVIASPRDTGAGALAGAIAGAAVGGVAEAASEQEQQGVESRASAAQAATLERQASNYRRALEACLEGRGYNVR